MGIGNGDANDKRNRGVRVVVVVMVCGGGNGNLTLGILRLNDRKSRHRKIKKQRRYERLAATSQLSFL